MSKDTPETYRFTCILRLYLLEDMLINLGLDSGDFSRKAGEYYYRLKPEL